jgi:hypothetical protein
MAAIASSAAPGQKLSFDISGEGTLQNNQEASTGGGTGQARPGGGLGAPIEAPDPLDKYRWYILGGFGLVLVGGAFYIVKRSRSVRVVGAEDPVAASAAAGSAAPSSSAPAASGHSGILLQALKEELFQLELEHKQGKISDADYAKTKAALDQTLARALRRN